MRASCRISRPTRCILLAATILLHLSPAWAQVQDLVLTERDNGKVLAAVVQQAIYVQLDGNPSTGYTWVLTSPNGNSVFATGPSTYAPDAGGAVGGGGTYTFPFLAKAPGETILSLSYQRPWDPGSVIQTFSVTVRVSQGPTLPRLSIVLKGANSVISWPMAGSDGFYLEGTRTLSSGWAALNVQPVPDGLNYSVTFPPSGRWLFFRLRQ